jgi:hypothetical protein
MVGLYRREEGRPWPTFHKLRNTCASFLIAAKLEPIKTYLGHASITMMYDLYGDLFPKADDPIAEAMGALRAAAGRRSPRVRGRCRRARSVAREHRERLGRYADQDAAGGGASAVVLTAAVGTVCEEEVAARSTAVRAHDRHPTRSRTGARPEAEDSAAIRSCQGRVAVYPITGWWKELRSRGPQLAWCPVCPAALDRDPSRGGRPLDSGGPAGGLADRHRDLIPARPGWWFAGGRLNPDEVLADYQRTRSLAQGADDRDELEP